MANFGRRSGTREIVAADVSRRSSNWGARSVSTDVGSYGSLNAPWAGWRDLALVTLAVIGLPALGGAPELGSRAAPEWDTLFQSQSGWIGADGAYSVPLSTNTTLWLFSDTFVGDVKDGRRTNVVMINNSVALQAGTNRPEFFYGTGRDGKPASFIKPKDRRGYFWLMHGTRTESGLYLFLLQVVTVRPNDPFGFKLVDCWLGKVTNPDDPPPKWRVTQQKVPFTKLTSKGGLIFGGAVVREGDFIYIFGGDSRQEAKKTAAQNRMVLARSPAEHLGDFDQWCFLANDDWQKDFKKVTPVLSNVGSEFSVSWLPARKRYAAVYSEGIWGRILLRLAPSLTGPWSEPNLVYRCPEMTWSPKVFCYAGKAHPELASAPDELLITYAANSGNFWEVISDARLYWPRFVRVKLNQEGGD
jgi:hypothetical protein